MDNSYPYILGHCRCGRRMIVYGWRGTGDDMKPHDDRRLGCPACGKASGDCVCSSPEREGFY